MSKRTYISFDWAIKKLLRDKANFAVLEGFISTVIQKDVKIDSILESESNKRSEDDKSNRVDILAEDTDKAKYLIEVQYESEKAYFQRILFDVSKHIIDYMKIGKGYQKIKKIYCINIVHFDLGRGDDYIYVGKTEFRGKHSGKLLSLSPFQKKEYNAEFPSDLYPEFIILKVNDFDKHAATPLEEWIEFLKTSKISDEASAPGLPEAREIMKLENMSHEERRAYEHYIEDLAILEDVKETARGEGKMEGEIEGMIKGKIEGKIEIARNMKAEGIPADVISKCTGLSLEEIEKL